MPHFHLRNTVLSDRRLPMPGRVVVMGRSLDADVPIPHESVSRRHALLEVTPDGHVISDLGSVNGTWVGDHRLAVGERAPVDLNSSFRLGDVEIILAPDESLDGRPDRLQLASTPPPAARASATPKPTPPAARSERSGRPDRARKSPPPPAVQRRAANLRKRRKTFFWAGVGITVVLLALAAFFIYRIATQEKDKPAAEDVRRP